MQNAIRIGLQPSSHHYSGSWWQERARQGNEQCSQQCTEYCTEEQPTEWSLVPTHRRGLSLKTGVASSNVATFYSQNWSSSATLMTFWWPLPPFIHTILDIRHRQSKDFLGDRHWIVSHLPGGHLPPPKFGHLPTPNSDIYHPQKKTFARRTSSRGCVVWSGVIWGRSGVILECRITVCYKMFCQICKRVVACRALPVLQNV